MTITWLERQHPLGPSLDRLLRDLDDHLRQHNIPYLLAGGMARESGGVAQVPRGRIGGNNNEARRRQYWYRRTNRRKQEALKDSILKVSRIRRIFGSPNEPNCRLARRPLTYVDQTQ